MNTIERFRKYRRCQLGGSIQKYGLGDKIEKGLAYLFNGQDGTFKEAFRKARNQGQKYFRWNGNLYSTKIAPTPTKNIRTKPTYSPTKKVLDLGETILEKQRKEMSNMWQYLTTVKKLSRRNAAMIMGNVWQESRFDNTKVSSKGATGFLQFLGDREADYRKWLIANPQAHKKYGQIDYILSAIDDKTNTHDLYRKEYEDLQKRILKARKIYEQSSGKNKIARKRDYDDLIAYKTKIYGDREKSGSLYFF